MDNRFTTVDDILKNAIIQFGEGNNANYNRYLSYLIRGYNELGYDLLKNVKRTFLAVDKSTKTALIPKDYVNYIRVGFVNQVNEIVDLSYNGNIKLETQNPYKNCHCDCGCDGEICYNTNTITSNTTLTETNQVLEAPERICDYTVVFNNFRLNECDYSYIRPSNDVFEGTTYVAQKIKKNGVYIYINQVITSLAELDALFIELGFTVDTNPIDPQYMITTTDVWEEYNYTIDNTDVNLTPTLSNCATATGIQFPLTINSIINYEGDAKNKMLLIPIVTIIDRVLKSEYELDAYFQELGWTKTTSYTYTVSSSRDWGVFNVTMHTLKDIDLWIAQTSCSVDVVSDVYKNTTRICQDESGNIIQESCVYGFTPIMPNCNYYVNMSGVIFGGASANNKYTVNGVEYSMGVINNSGQLRSKMLTFGFVTDASNPLTFRAYGSFNVWNNFKVNNVDYPPTNNYCLEGYEIVQKCTTTTICNIPKKECGCPELNDEIVNTLYTCGWINAQACQRYIRGGDMYMKQALYDSAWGWFNVDYYNGVIQLNDSFGLDTIYLEYYSANEIDDAEYLVPLLAQDALISYIDMMRTRSKVNIPLYEKQRSEKRYSVEKKKLSQRLTPLRIQELLDILRTRQKP